MGSPADVYSLRHLDGDLHPLFCHPHSIVKSKSSQKSPFLRNFEKTSQIAAKAG